MWLYYLLSLLLGFTNMYGVSKRSCLTNNCPLLSICHNQTTNNFSIVDIRNKQKTICNPGCWQLTKGGPYKPNASNPEESNPLIKVIGSHIELNFNGNHIENIDDTSQGWIGIEIGYSPAELAANSSLRQPKNIIINNVHLRNFDCGILVHKGVEQIIIKDSVLLDCSMGIVMLGDPNSYPTLPSDQLNAEEIKNAVISNCKIIGHNQNKRTALVNLKTIIETTYGYSTDLFMPLRADRLNASTIDVYTYSGILATHVQELLISCVTIQNIGNSNFSLEGNGTRTSAIAILLRNSTEISIQSTKTNNTYGNVRATGLQLELICGINIYNSEFCHAKSNYIATGIDTFPDLEAKAIDGLSSGFDYTVEEIDLCEVKTEFQRSSVFSIGIYLVDTRGLNGESVFSERNLALTGSFGLITFTSADINFTNSSFTRNISGAPTLTLKNHLMHPLFRFPIPIAKKNLGVATDGICCIGFLANNTQNISLTNTNCDNNIGENTARGMYCIQCNNCFLENNSYSKNQSFNGKRLNEDLQIRTAQDANIISKHAPILPEAQTGGYGFVANNNCQNITINNCKAEYNTGHRSSGFSLIDCTNISITNSSASHQQATGKFLSTDVQALNRIAVPLLSVHAPLFVSDACMVDATFTTIDFTSLLEDTLDHAREIRADQITGGVQFTDEEIVASGITLAYGAMARFRLWGTAFGIHIHNGQDIILQHNNCVGQTATKDSAMGIIITGRSSQFEVTDCNLSYNEAWTDSKQAFWTTSPNPSNLPERYQYNLSELKDFWVNFTGENSGVQLTDNVGADVLSIAFSNSGTSLAVADASSSTNLRIYSMSSNTPEQILNIHTQDVNSVAWSPDDTLLASGSDDDDVLIWNTSTWTVVQTLTNHFGNVNAVAWKPDGTQLASASDDDTVRIFNTTTWVQVQNLNIGSDANTVAWKPDGTQLAVGNDANNIIIYNTSTWSVIQTITNHTGDVFSVAWKPDGTQLASGSQDNTVRIFNTTTWAQEQLLTNHTQDVFSVAWKPDGTQLASGSEDNTTIIWNATTWTPITTITNHTQDVNTVAWNFNGSRLASGSQDDTFIIFETTGFTIDEADAISGFNTSGSNFIAEGEQLFGNAVTNSLYPSIYPNGSIRNLINIFAPTAAGLLLSDLCDAGYIDNNTFNNNFGHSGHGFGLSMQNGFNITISDNTILHNGSNIYGIGSGFFDLASYSANTYIRNFLASNKVKNYVNSNIFVPMGNVSGNTFQVDSLTNGLYNRNRRNVHNLQILLPNDNDACTIESTLDGAVQSNLTTIWNSNSWIA